MCPIIFMERKGCKKIGEVENNEILVCEKKIKYPKFEVNYNKDMKIKPQIFDKELEREKDMRYCISTINKLWLAVFTSEERELFDKECIGRARKLNIDSLKFSERQTQLKRLAAEVKQNILENRKHFTRKSVNVG